MSFVSAGVEKTQSTLCVCVFVTLTKWICFCIWKRGLPMPLFFVVFLHFVLDSRRTEQRRLVRSAPTEFQLVTEKRSARVCLFSSNKPLLSFFFFLVPRPLSLRLFVCVYRIFHAVIIAVLCPPQPRYSLPFSPFLSLVFISSHSMDYFESNGRKQNLESQDDYSFVDWKTFPIPSTFGYAFAYI